MLKYNIRNFSLHTYSYLYFTVKQTTKDVSYLGVIIAGIGITGSKIYLLE